MFKKLLLQLIIHHTKFKPILTSVSDESKLHAHILFGVLFSACLLFAPDLDTWQKAIDKSWYVRTGSRFPTIGMLTHRVCWQKVNSHRCVKRVTEISLDTCHSEVSLLLPILYMTPATHLRALPETSDINRYKHTFTYDNSDHMFNAE